MPTRVKFWKAPEVESIAHCLIPEHHKHLLECAVPVVYYFRSTTPRSKGKYVLAKAMRFNDFQCFLADLEAEEIDPDVDETAPDNEARFAIVVSHPIWPGLTDKQKTALIHHELCHLWAEEDEDGIVKLSILPHDFEGFASEIELFGVWSPDIAPIALALAPHVAQLRMELHAEEAEAANA